MCEEGLKVVVPILQVVCGLVVPGNILGPIVYGLFHGSWYGYVRAPDVVSSRGLSDLGSLLILRVLSLLVSSIWLCVFLWFIRCVIV